MLKFINSIPNSEEVKFKAFGTECLIRVSAELPRDRQDLLNVGVLEAQRIEKKYSRFLPDSEMSRINRLAATASCTIDSETSSLLELAKLCFEESNGLFDITAAPLIELWSKAEQRPSKEILSATLKNVGFSKLKLSAQAISFGNAGMKLDLGGLGKEYAVDRVCEVLRARGAKGFLVNFGGDLRVEGLAPINVGIQAPTSPDRILTYISAANCAVVTSGDYARGKVIDGKRYSHIINPKTGEPSQFFASVTVLHQSATLAGIATTTAILLESKGVDYLRSAALPFYALQNDGNVVQG